jgi:hypothetical protein
MDTCMKLQQKFNPNLNVDNKIIIYFNFKLHVYSLMNLIQGFH